MSEPVIEFHLKNAIVLTNYMQVCKAKEPILLCLTWHIEIPGGVFF